MPRAVFKAFMVLIALLWASSAAAGDVSIMLFHQMIRPAKSTHFRLDGSSGVVTIEIHDLEKGRNALETVCVLKKDESKAVQDQAMSLLSPLPSLIEEKKGFLPDVVHPIMMIIVNDGTEERRWERLSNDRNEISQQASDFLKAWDTISYAFCKVSLYH